jgi:hypothetical protein
VHLQVKRIKYLPINLSGYLAQHTIVSVSYIYNLDLSHSNLSGLVVAYWFFPLMCSLGF